MRIAFLVVALWMTCGPARCLGRNTPSTGAAAQNSTSAVAGAFAPLCSNQPPGRLISANPSNYRSLLSALKPGETLALVAGRYAGLYISHLRGAASQCIVI